VGRFLPIRDRDRWVPGAISMRGGRTAANFRLIETDDGTMVLAAVVDISDRKREDGRLRAALKEKEILLGEVHHRVKNNLQIVHSLLDLQSARITDPVAIDMLRESQNRIKSMALIHQLLYVSGDFAEVDFRAFLDTLIPIWCRPMRWNPIASRSRSM
jgi:Histidine kinase